MEEKEKDEKKGIREFLKTAGKAITAGVAIYGVKTLVETYCVLKREQRRAAKKEIP